VSELNGIVRQETARELDHKLRRVSVAGAMFIELLLLRLDRPGPRIGSRRGVVSVAGTFYRPPARPPAVVKVQSAPYMVKEMLVAVRDP
jgi:hypothetical protein